MQTDPTTHIPYTPTRYEVAWPPHQPGLFIKGNPRNAHKAVYTGALATTLVAEPMIVREANETCIAGLEDLIFVFFSSAEL